MFFRQLYRGRPDLRPEPVRNIRGARLLDELLMPALRGAVALPEMDRAAVFVAQDLDLDVAGVGDIFLNVQRAVSEGGFRLRRRLLENLADLVLLVFCDDLHAAPAASGGRLEHDREPDSADGVQNIGVRVHLFRAGQHGDADLPGERARDELVAHPVDMFGFRPDKNESAVMAGLRQLRLLGQKAVAGVERLGSRSQRRLNESGDIQVRRYGRRADNDGPAGQPRCRRILIRLRGNEDSFDAQNAACPDDPGGDLAPVCHKYSGYFHRLMENRGWPGSSTS